MSKKRGLAIPSSTQCNSGSSREDTARSLRPHGQTLKPGGSGQSRGAAPPAPNPAGARAVTPTRNAGPEPHGSPPLRPGHRRGAATRPAGSTPAAGRPRCPSRRARGAPRTPLTLPLVGEEERAAGRRGPAQAKRLGVKDEEPEGEVCRPAPRDTWHGAGRRAGSGGPRPPTPSRAAAWPGDWAAAERPPGAAPWKGCARPSRCLVSAGGGGRAVGREPLPGAPRRGAAGVNAAEQTGPGPAARGGEERPPGGAAAPPLRPPRRQTWGGSPGSLRGGPSRTRHSPVPGPAPSS